MQKSTTRLEIESRPEGFSTWSERATTGWLFLVPFLGTYVGSVILFSGIDDMDLEDYIAFGVLILGGPFMHVMSIKHGGWLQTRLAGLVIRIFIYIAMAIGTALAVFIVFTMLGAIGIETSGDGSFSVAIFWGTLILIAIIYTPGIVYILDGKRAYASPINHSSPSKKGFSIEGVFPSVLGKWARGVVRKYPEPSGYSVAYLMSMPINEGVVCTFYFLPGHHDSKREYGCDTSYVEEHFAESVHELEVVYAEKLSDLVQIDFGKVIIGQGGNSLAALHASYNGKTKEGQEEFTHLFVTSTNHSLIKVRLTSTVSMEKITDDVTSLCSEIVSIARRQQEKINYVDINDENGVLTATLIPEDKINVSSIAELISQGGLEIVSVDGNCISANHENRRVNIAINAVNKTIKIFMVFSYRADAGAAEKIQLNDKVNDEIVMCRFATPAEHRDLLSSDYWLCYAGGICDVQFISTLRFFVNSTYAAMFRCNGKDLII